MNKLLASASDLQGIIKMINLFFCSDGKYSLDQVSDNTWNLSHPSVKLRSKFWVDFKKGRYRFMVIRED